MDKTKVCVICKKCDGRLIIVSKTTKDTLIKSSKAPKDGRDEKILTTSPVHVVATAKESARIRIRKKKIETATTTSKTRTICPCYFNILSPLFYY